MWDFTFAGPCKSSGLQRLLLGPGYLGLPGVLACKVGRADRLVEGYGWAFRLGERTYCISSTHGLFP